MLRFAPSPNGLLHLGHAFSALTNEAVAAAVGAPLTVRMEDIDRSRARACYEEAILEDLDWLAIRWQPPMRRQSEHLEQYAAALDRLKARGLVYPSFASRREVIEATVAGGPRDPDGAPRFPGDAAVIGAAETARRRACEAPAAWRLAMARAVAAVGEVSWTHVDRAGRPVARILADPLAWGDVVLARKDVPTSYHLSVVVDDADQGIDYVVRGRDLAPATAVHRVLQVLLDLPEPRYHHHRLLLGADGRKLSKSNGDRSLRALREAGLTPAEVRRMAQD